MTINVIFPLAAKHATKLVAQVLQPLGLRADWVAHSASSAAHSPADGNVSSFYNICVERQFGKDPVGLVALVHNALTSLRQTAAIADADVTTKASVPGANDSFPNLVPRRRSLYVYSIRHMYLHYMHYMRIDQCIYIYSVDAILTILKSGSVDWVRVRHP